MKIYRGDSDPKLVRRLKFSIDNGEGLFTNLIDSGNPLALQQKQLFETIDDHVFTGWSKTHFLSFSKKHSISVSFAAGNPPKSITSSNQSSWDAMIASIDISQLAHIKNIDIGVDHYSFQEKCPSTYCVSPPGLLLPVQMKNYQERLKNNQLRKFEIILIDVEAHLRHLQKSNNIIKNQTITLAANAEEVLVIPFDPMPDGVGHSALLQMSGLFNIEFYKF